MRCGPERKRTETAASVSFSKQFFRGGDGAAASGGGRRGRAPRPLLPCRRYGGVQIAADVSRRRRRRQGRARFPPSLPPSLFPVRPFPARARSQRSVRRALPCPAQAARCAATRRWPAKAATDLLLSLAAAAAAAVDASDAIEKGSSSFCMELEFTSN